MVEADGGQDDCGELMQYQMQHQAVFTTHRIYGKKH
jgi:hypothetical protein